MEGKGTAVREGGLLAPGDAGADGDGAARRAGVKMNMATVRLTPNANSVVFRGPISA